MRILWLPVIAAGKSETARMRRLRDACLSTSYVKCVCICDAIQQTPMNFHMEEEWNMWGWRKSRGGNSHGENESKRRKIRMLLRNSSTLNDVIVRARSQMCTFEAAPLRRGIRNLWQDFQGFCMAYFTYVLGWWWCWQTRKLK